MSLFFFFLPLGGEVSYAETFPGLVQEIDPADWVSPIIVLEVQGKTNSAINPLKARLYNVTADAPVAGSDVTISATVTDRQRSASFSLAAGAKEYKVQHGCRPGGTATAYKADLIVDSAP